MTTESEIREDEEYWEALQREVDRRGIQWVGEIPEPVEAEGFGSTPEAPELAPKRTRDASLTTQSPSKRRRDRQLPRRRGSVSDRQAKPGTP
jgi:hypothetical protein